MATVGRNYLWSKNPLNAGPTIFKCRSLHLKHLSLGLHIDIRHCVLLSRAVVFMPGVHPCWIDDKNQRRNMANALLPAIAGNKCAKIQLCNKYEPLILIEDLKTP